MKIGDIVMRNCASNSESIELGIVRTYCGYMVIETRDYFAVIIGYPFNKCEVIGEL